MKHYFGARRLAEAAAVTLFGHAAVSGGATLAYSTYLGASGYDGAYAVVTDAAGDAILAGRTDAAGGTNDFPLLHPLQPHFGGGRADAYVAKFDPAGRLLFSTYFGGSSYEAIECLALDLEGNLVVVGESHSTDLPTTPDAFQPDYAGGSFAGDGDGFIARIAGDGSRLLYCSYFGGTGDERINGVAVDGEGNVCLTGHTTSRDLPVKNAFQPAFGGGTNDTFVAKFDPTLTHLVFSTYLGGNDAEGDERIATDPAGYIYVSGWTQSTNFPVTAGAFQTHHKVVADIGPNWDAVISKFKPDGSALVYSTYVGSATVDAAYGIAADAEGNAYVTGVISASWDPGTFPLGFQPAPGYGNGDAWVAKLKPDGSNFAWFSYLGGSGADAGFGLALDASNNVYVTGITDSQDFPTVDAPQPHYGGGQQDAFVAKVSADGQHLLYSTYLGGGDAEWGYAVAADGAGNAIAVGQTASISFLTLNAVQTANASSRTNANPADAYVTKLTPAVEEPPLTIVRSDNHVLISWPTDFSGFNLESATTIDAPAADWQTVSVVPLVISGQNTVILGAGSAAGFYLLKRP